MRFVTAQRSWLPQTGGALLTASLVATGLAVFLVYLSSSSTLALLKTTNEAVRSRTRVKMDGGAKRRLQIRPYEGDPEGCGIPTLDEVGLQDYGCKILRKVCFDQNRMIVFSAEPDHVFDYPYFRLEWSPSFIPGYDEVQARAEAPDKEQFQPLVRKNSSADRPDLKDPIFSRCHAPLVWATPWVIAFSEFLLNSFVPLWYMQHQLRLFDMRTMLVPLLDGYEAPPFVEFLLRPYTDGIIAPFHEVSSRQHMYDPTFPRCFETVAVCGLKNMYNDRPGPKFHKPGEADPNVTTFYGDPEWKTYHPLKAGRSLVNFYTDRGVLKEPTPQPNVLKVVVANRTGPFRRFLELEKFLEDCNAWVPPEVQGGPKRVLCEAWTFGGGLVADAQKLQEIDVLITHHGAELHQGFFMPWGSSVIEVRPWGFSDFWGDLYFHSLNAQETLVFYWQAKVTKRENWKPTDWEAQGMYKFQEIKLELNRHSIPRWPLYQPILEAIVLTNRSREAYLARPYESLLFEV